MNQVEDPARRGSPPTALGAEKDGRARSPSRVPQSARLAYDPNIWRAMEVSHAGG